MQGFCFDHCVCFIMVVEALNCWFVRYWFCKRLGETTYLPTLHGSFQWTLCEFIAALFRKARSEFDLKFFKETRVANVTRHQNKKEGGQVLVSDEECLLCCCAGSISSEGLGSVFWRGPHSSPGTRVDKFTGKLVLPGQTPFFTCFF